MKDFENQLRQLIRETLLAESQSPTARAAAAGLALHSWTRGETSGVIIYDPKILLERVGELVIGPGGALPNVWEIRRVIRDSIHENCIVRSAVSYNTPRSHSPCWGAEIVQYSVSADDGHPHVSKMGPAAYEAAMWYAHALTPDRSLVSQSAERVWKKYLQRAEGGDITALPFDDVEDPKTPEPEDDCYVHGSRRPSLNNAYTLKSRPSGIDTLERNHGETADTLESDYGFDEMELSSSLQKLAIQLFESQYDESL